jgi:hypothetical protein
LVGDIEPNILPSTSLALGGFFMIYKEKDPRMTEEQTAKLFEGIPLDKLGDETDFNAHVRVDEQVAKLFPDQATNVDGEYLLPRRLVKKL